MTNAQLEKFRQENMAYYGFGPSAMKAIRACDECGIPAPQEKQYCTECGHKLPEKTLYDLYLERHAVCSECKTVLAEKMKFCPQCGMRIQK